MKNIVDYVENEKRTFHEREFQAIDSLVLSIMAYWHFNGIVHGPLENTGVAFETVATADIDGALLKDVNNKKSNGRLLGALSASPRFRDLRLMHYVDVTNQDEQKQFCAITFLLGDGTAYVAFRGTDGTLVGWKEDFNMSYTCPVPAQVAGVVYLDEVARHTDRPLRIGGHSKGGNIAVYAAMMCEESNRQRICDIYSHDGPGFRKEILESDGYRAVMDRVHRTLPQSSMVGMILYQQGEYDVVRSRGIGIMQHDPFLWTVEGDDFHYAQRLTGSALYMNQTLNSWLSGYSDEKRARFIDTLYDVIVATNATTSAELTEDWYKKAVAVLNAARDVDEDTRKFILDTVRALVALSLKNIPQEARKSLQGSAVYKRVMIARNRKVKKQEEQRGKLNEDTQ